MKLTIVQKPGFILETVTLETDSFYFSHVIKYMLENHPNLFIVDTEWYFDGVKILVTSEV